MGRVDELQRRMIAGDEVTADELVAAKAADELDVMQAEARTIAEREAAERAREAALQAVIDEASGQVAAVNAAVLATLDDLEAAARNFAAAVRDRGALAYATASKLTELGRPTTAAELANVLGQTISIDDVDAVALIADVTGQALRDADLTHVNGAGKLADLTDHHMGGPAARVRDKLAG